METNNMDLNEVQETPAEVVKQPAEEQEWQKPSLLRMIFLDNIFILYIETFLLMLLGAIAGSFVIGTIELILGMDGAFYENNPDLKIAMMYANSIGLWIVLYLRCGIRKKSRSYIMWKNSSKERAGNNMPWLITGLLTGFGLNNLCAVVAYICKDISLEYGKFQILPLSIILVCVFVQSGSEELLCRGFLYERLRMSYKNPWVAIIGNSVFFGLLHLGNDGVTVISIINIIAAGLAFSLFVYYFDSMWAAIAMHTAWNFTQNIILGLPNSGIVSPYSLFKLDAANARNSFAYNVEFGLEGTIVADVVLIAACIVLIVYGRKHRLAQASKGEEHEDLQHTN